MANVDAAFGFVPIRHMSGNAPRANKYTITSGLAENIFTGDLCILTADGVITPHTATETNKISGTMAAGIATCKIIALYDSPDNAFGANAIMEVLIDEHILGTNVAGI